MICSKCNGNVTVVPNPELEAPVNLRAEFVCDDCGIRKPFEPLLRVPNVVVFR